MLIRWFCWTCTLAALLANLAVIADSCSSLAWKSSVSSTCS